MRLVCIVSALFLSLIAMQAVAEEHPATTWRTPAQHSGQDVSAQVTDKLPAKAQRMLDDLGSPEEQEHNNGKKFTCHYGGTKTVTVSLLEDAVMFSGDYNNCREAGITRDGHYEVIVQNWEIVGESSERSVNGQLFDAAVAGDIGKVSTLIKKKADVNYAEDMRTTSGDNVRGWTPLMSAAMNGNVDMAQSLVKAGAWVNYMNSSVTSALWIAANNGSFATEIGRAHV